MQLQRPVHLRLLLYPAAQDLGEAGALGDLHRLRYSKPPINKTIGDIVITG